MAILCLLRCNQRYRCIKTAPRIGRRLEKTMTAKPLRLTAPIPLERDEQKALFKWAAIETRRDARLALLNSSQNGIRTTVQNGRLAKECGMKRGHPDVNLPVPCGGYHGLYIEMKRRNGSRSDLRPEQLWWMSRLNEQGYCAVVAYGWEDAVKIILGYLRAKL